MPHSSTRACFALRGALLAALTATTLSAQYSGEWPLEADVGGFTADMNRKPTDPPITNEWQNGLKNDVGTIAMARTPDPNSATSQFFINVNNNRSLTPPPGRGIGYAVFGKVVAGMDVVNAIKGVATTTRARMGDVLVTPIVIEKTTVISKDEAMKLMKPKSEASASD